MSQPWFEDPQVDNCVRRALGKFDGELTADELASVVSLDMREKGLWSLEGIDALVGLRELRFNLVHNTVKDYSPLAKLMGLQVLIFESPTGIGYPGAPETRALEAIARLPNIRHISLFNCDVTDLTPLKGLSHLRFLDLRKTDVARLRPLAGLTALETLMIGETEVRTLYPLDELPSLRTLEASELRISGGELKRLSGLQHLRTLDLTDNPLTELTALQSLVRLEKLVVRNTKLTAIDGLEALRGLRWLDLQRNSIRDLGPLSGLSQLRYVDARNNRVESWAPVAHVPRVGGRPAKGSS